jgi:ubiquinone/menaquinone biosynthesis C-methylase UbiE
MDPFVHNPLLRARKKLSWQARARLDRASKASLIRSLPKDSAILDVGCGNESATMIRNYRKDLRLFGIDIGDYMITDADKALMETYIVCPPEEFADGILSFDREFDVVLSSHNLEHCIDPKQALDSMARVVAPGGRIYLSFPSEASVRLPSRDGCLNFYDDPTHRTVLNFDELLEMLQARDFRILLAVRRNRGNARIGWCIGALQEPWSYLSGKVRSYTWNFWGFESVILARRSG